MKSRPTQFGARENTASPRQHAPRFAENARSNAICIEEENSEVAEHSLLAEALAEGSKSLLHATSQHAATEGEGRTCAERSAQPSRLEQLPSQTAAQRAVETFRSAINAVKAAVPVTLRQLVKHYEENELPSKAFSTQRTFQTSLKTWVLPKWGEHGLSDVRTVEVEGWLHSLPLANATKAKIRNTMHVIFAHAGRHEWIATNPITLVRQSAKREKLPDVLELDELKKLLAELENPARALVFLTAATGLRVSEALGLKWSDVDFAAREIRLSRAVVHQHVGDMKTESSQKPVPMDGALLDALQDWSRQAPYRQMGDWAFASPDMDGKQPYWPETPLKCYVQPAAKRVGITKALGWHSPS